MIYKQSVPFIEFVHFMTSTESIDNSLEESVQVTSTDTDSTEVEHEDDNSIAGIDKSTINTLSQPIRLFLFGFLAMSIMSFFTGLFASPFIQDVMLGLTIVIFGTLVYKILLLGKQKSTKSQRSTGSTTTGASGNHKDDDGNDVNLDALDNTPFGWSTAMHCDDLDDEGKRSQCEYDAFTLQQQLGGFGYWVKDNPNDRMVYVKDFERLRKGRCNLFQREDLQTACKKEALGNF